MMQCCTGLTTKKPHLGDMVNPNLLDLRKEGKSWAKMWQLATIGET